MRKTIQRLLRSEDGATTAEYGFLIVVCTGAALAALLILDQSVKTLADKARERMGAVDGASSSKPADAPAGDRGRGWGTDGNSEGGNPPPKSP